MGLIDDIIAGDAVNFGPPATTPTATGTGYPTLNELLAELGLPLLGAITSKEQGNAAKRAAGIALAEKYQPKLNAAENALYQSGAVYSNGRWVRDEAGSGGSIKDMLASGALKVNTTSGHPTGYDKINPDGSVLGALTDDEYVAIESGSGGKKTTVVIPASDPLLKAWTDAAYPIENLKTYTGAIGPEGLPSAEKEKAPVKLTAGQFATLLPGGDTGGAYNLDQFLSSVLAGLGMEATPWRMNLMREWAKGEGTGAGFNPLATTQTGGEDPINPHWNSNGGVPVKNYKDFQTGVAQTVKTMTNGFYPLIIQTLTNQQVVPGAGEQARKWGTIHLAEVLDSGKIPDSSGYLGANPGKGSNYDVSKVQGLFDKYGSWEAVAGALYDETPNPSMSREQFVTTAMSNLGTFVKNVSEGSVTPSGYSVTGTPSAGGAAANDPLKAYLESGKYGLEVQRAGESDRDYKNTADRYKDYLSAAAAANNLVQDEADMRKASAAMNDSAIATAVKANEATDSYWQKMGGAIWSDPLAHLYDKLEQAPEGFVDAILRTVPKNVPLPYSLNEALGLPDDTKQEYWGTPRYAEGTTGTNPYPGVSWQDVPYIALYHAGKNVPSSILNRLVQAGAISAPTPTSTTVQSGGYQEGYVSQNSLLPEPKRVYDDSDWLEAAVQQFAHNVTAGEIGLPAEWGVTNLQGWVGVPASQMPATLLNQFRQILTSKANTPEIIQEFGKAPGVATSWVPNPSAPAAPKVSANAGGGGGMYNGYGNTSTQYGGTYTGGMDAGEAARIGLEKEQLALQKQIADAQMKLDRERFDLTKIQDTRSAEYMAKDQLIKDAQLLLQQQAAQLAQKDSELKALMFDEEKRRFEIENGRAADQFELYKIAQEADLRYKDRQIVLQEGAAALDREKFNDQKTRDDRNFEYQKSKDDRALNLERGKIIAEATSKPYDAVYQQFTYANMKAPKGEAIDMFTGQSRGMKDRNQVYEEDAEIYKNALRPIPQAANGTGFVTDPLLVTGDDPDSNRGTGYDETIWNPTGAPLAIFSNKDSQQIGMVPKKGKPFGKHVRKGVA